MYKIIYGYIMGFISALATTFVVGVITSTTFQYPQLSNISTIEWVNDENIIEEKFESHYYKHGVRVNGLAYVGGTECIIYARIPESNKDINLLVFGHEVLHCFGMKHE